MKVHAQWLRLFREGFPSLLPTAVALVLLLSTSADVFAYEQGYIYGYNVFTAITNPSPAADDRFGNIGEVEDGIRTLTAPYTLADAPDAAEMPRVRGEIRDERGDDELR